MPTLLKVVVYFAVFFGLLIVHNAMPKSTEPLKAMVAFLWLTWCIGGVFIIFRSIYRFITR